MKTSHIVEAPKDAADQFSRLAARIDSRRAKVGIIGLGYVGLPLGLAFARAGFSVTGIDVDSSRVSALCDGNSYITDLSNAEIREAVQQQRFTPTSDLESISSLDTISICVPTPLRKTKDPDLSFVVSAVGAIAGRLRRGQLIVLESTTYPGTTEELVLPRLAESGLRVGEDYFLAYSPERVDPGNQTYRTNNIPKIVGGVTQRCAELGALLYGKFVDRVMAVSSTRVAEMVKLLENTFRSVNIALANEIGMLCAHMKIDVWEVIKAASTKPFGFMPFYPGPGLGGHCIPIDPIYLQWKARMDGFEPRFIELADRINSSMPRFVAIRAMELLNEVSRPLKGSRIHVLGVTYKRDVNDVRESPAFEVIKLFLERGADVSYSDPFVPSITAGRRTLRSAPPSREVLAACDLAIILADHSSFDYRAIVDSAPLVFDTRNAASGIQAPHLIRL